MATWTIIGNTSIDVDSPFNTTLLTSFRDNMEYNFERYPRTGTHAVGVRLVLARGTKTLAAAAGTLIVDGTGNLYSANITPTVITFSTDAADGNPNFLTATTPIILLSCEEDTSGGKLDWTSNHVAAGPFVQDGSLSNTAFTLECQFHTDTNSAGVGAIFQWVAIGQPSSGE